MRSTLGNSLLFYSFIVVPCLRRCYCRGVVGGVLLQYCRCCFRDFAIDLLVCAIVALAGTEGTETHEPSLALGRARVGEVGEEYNRLNLTRTSVKPIYYVLVCS